MTEEEYNELVRDYYETVFKKIYNNVRDYQLAEDLTQATFCKAYKFKHQWNRESRASSWLYRITVNEVNMYFRKIRTATDFAREFVDKRDIHEICDSEYGNYSYTMQDPIDKKRFDKNLSPEEIQIIKLRYMGHATADIAIILGKSIPAIKSRTHRLRAKISSGRKYTHKGTKRQPTPKMKIPEKHITKVYKFIPNIQPKQRKTKDDYFKTVGTGDIKRAVNG